MFKALIDRKKFSIFYMLHNLRPPIYYNAKPPHIILYQVNIIYAILILSFKILKLKPLLKNPFFIFSHLN